MTQAWNPESLCWLPAPPADFAQRCRSTLGSEGLGRLIRELASYNLDENQLNRLANVVEKARRQGLSLAPLAPFRLAIVSNSTTDFLIPALMASAARSGLNLECVVAGYGQAVQAALAPDSQIHTAKPDAVLVALDYRDYPFVTSPGNAEQAKATVNAAFGQLDAIRNGIHSNGNAICIVQNLAPTVEGVFGSLDKVLPGTLRGMVEELNWRIAGSIAGTKDVLLDVAGLASTVGLANWHSPEQWNLAKLPFSSAYLPLYAEHVVRTLAALRGKSRRCLVLDLDNTLWGGVIGDDGLEGIRLAQGDATGEAYLSLQRYILTLRERGIVLAVSSKNQDETARLPFRSHPEMLLREDQIAVFQANWNDKATNIKAIAGELSLGLESLVFLDDNPVERALVRRLLPEVAVPELPDDPALYVRALSAAGYFESAGFSDEDLKRADFYQDNARRVALQNQFANLDSYLESLQMVITFQPFDETGRSRITQLINKSNQFNLTTRRYTEAQVAAVESDPDAFSLQVRLTDTFGDNGMISVVICRKAGVDVWEIDTWLMSCRVLSRRVENAVLQEILAAAKEAGIRKLTGKYIPTERNKLVEQHYQNLGFTQTGGAPEGTTLWELEVASAPLERLPMDVQRRRSQITTAATVE
jgi:FkbH-like protein